MILGQTRFDEMSQAAEELSRKKLDVDTGSAFTQGIGILTESLEPRPAAHWLDVMIHSCRE